jgi:hypothetical protein
MDTTKNRPTPAARPMSGFAPRMTKRPFKFQRRILERRNFRPTMATAVGVAVGVPEA